MPVPVLMTEPMSKKRTKNEPLSLTSLSSSAATCKENATEWLPNGNWKSDYLSGHNIKCNSGEYLNGFVYERDGNKNHKDEKVRFRYNCCSATNNDDRKKEYEQRYPIVTFAQSDTIRSKNKKKNKNGTHPTDKPKWNLSTLIPNTDRNVPKDSRKGIWCDKNELLNQVVFNAKRGAPNETGLEYIYTCSKERDLDGYIQKEFSDKKPRVEYMHKTNFNKKHFGNDTRTLLDAKVFCPDKLGLKQFRFNHDNNQWKVEYKCGTQVQV
jgi:hypothetical protein